MDIYCLAWLMAKPTSTSTSTSTNINFEISQEICSNMQCWIPIHVHNAFIVNKRTLCSFHKISVNKTSPDRNSPANNKTGTGPYLVQGLSKLPGTFHWSRKSDQEWTFDCSGPVNGKEFAKLSQVGKCSCTWTELVLLSVLCQPPTQNWFIIIAFLYFAAVFS